MELVTGRKGTPHITSQQDRMKNQGIWGDQVYILNTGQMLEPQVQSSNEIRIRDGALMAQGALSCVKINSYDSVTIQNGSQGMKRIDLICWQYTYDAEQDVESAEWVVIQGTPAASDPQQPAYTEGDIQQGDELVQVPIFAVHLDGINVTGVDVIPEVMPDIPTLNAYLSDLTNETTTTEYDKTVINFTSAWSTRHCEVYKTGRIVQLSARIYSGTIVKDYEYTIANVNTEFRPAHETPIYAVAGDAYMQNLVPCMCLIQPSGKILFKASGEQKLYVDIAGTYIV